MEGAWTGAEGWTGVDGGVDGTGTGERDGGVWCGWRMEGNETVRDLMWTGVDGGLGGRWRGRDWVLTGVDGGVG